MKQKLFTLFVAIVATTALWAYDCVVDDIYYNLNSTDMTAEVVARGDEHRYSGSIAIPSTITYNSQTYSVTTIGDGAFYECSGLTSVTIGNSVTTIGNSAFFWCSGLTSITIPNSVTTIGNSAFSWCSGLTSITIPNSVTTIGDNAFWGCSGLTSVIISNSVTTIGDGAFDGCYRLTSVTIPNSVITIENGAFYHCSGLTSVTIGNSVTTIGEQAFYECYSLTSVTIPNSVTTIGNYAFFGCSGLTLITIGNSVTTIGDKAFDGCSNIKQVFYDDCFLPYFTAWGIPSSAELICTNPITASIVVQKICYSTIKLDIPSMYNKYDEIGLAFCPSSAFGTNYASNTEGIVEITNLLPMLNFCGGIGQLYAKKGSSYIYTQDFLDIAPNKPILSYTVQATQTTITLSNISAITDESVKTLTMGIYCNGKDYEVDENNSVKLTGLTPNKKCSLEVYACYNEHYYFREYREIPTLAIEPMITISQLAPSSVYACGHSMHGDASLLSTELKCLSNANAPQGDEGYFTGLKPNTTYVFEYNVNTKEGGIFSTTDEITTPELILTTLNPKVVSAGTAVVAAETNISDLETNVGFEWRKYDAPESMPSKSGTAIICNGVMEGRLLNLGTDAYWNVRPYYEAADGTRYYGEWITFDPSDFSYFEPTVHTYALTTSPTSNNVQVRGYVMTGTDEVTEQGFEYWANGAAAPQRVAATTPNDVQRVTATGQLMTAVLENLAYNTTYTCRAYALANGKTYYGEEIQFLTPENTTGLFDVFMNNSNAQKVTKYLHNGQLIIDRNGQHYSVTGQKLR